MLKTKILKEIKGDASHRKFFRKNFGNSTSIIVFSQKEKYKNLLIYDSINRILNMNNILAPKLYSENFDQNYIEIQDFGDETIYKTLNRKGIDKLKYFKKIVKVLKKIQLIKNRKVRNFNNRIYYIPKYEKKILFNEANLFCEWFINQKLSLDRRKRFQKKFKILVTKIIKRLNLKNNVFVHRDFHVSNLMLKNDQICVIDSQDALVGNRAYDLASLIDDVRFKTPKSFKTKIFDFYLKTEKKIDQDQFKNDFEILSVLRNLKIIGIFTRLAIRDGKKKYLKLIPHAWKLIDYRIHNNKNLKTLRDLLVKNFKKEFNED